MSESRQGGRHGLTLLLSGVALGAAIVWLTSPRSGAENRAKIGRYLQERRRKMERIPRAFSAAAAAARGAFQDSYSEPFPGEPTSPITGVS